jgi:hypothetical protein
MEAILREEMLKAEGCVLNSPGLWDQQSAISIQHSFNVRAIRSIHSGCTELSVRSSTDHPMGAGHIGSGWSA